MSNQLEHEAVSERCVADPTRVAGVGVPPVWHGIGETTPRVQWPGSKFAKNEGADMGSEDTAASRGEIGNGHLEEKESSGNALVASSEGGDPGRVRYPSGQQRYDDAVESADGEEEARYSWQYVSSRVGQSRKGSDGWEAVKRAAGRKARAVARGILLAERRVLVGK
ncbi:hypothetical protein CLOM_g37 [Closterium sp. NIES-68]|nr:hypothetical protein CLOM_g37 [Closterium sp. NIES-68]GJP73549.1 hypothetical protein CLOP_g4249 [Closterium sp. NIES-67]